MTNTDVNDILSEMRALRAEVGEVKLCLARMEGEGHRARLEDIERRTRVLEHWRSGLAALAAVGGSAGGLALAKLLLGGQ